MEIFAILVGLGVIVFITLMVSIMYRVVVPTNEVHIVQKRKEAMPFGKDQSNGNVYYNWPHWLPLLGITRIVLPVSNFTISLNDYQAYDSGKVPFGIDVKAFFRVEHAPTAAQRVSSFDELKAQLEDILKGAIRKTLASKDIEEIMVGRGEFGVLFTKEVADQLTNWGVESVKSIEFMDIRDGQGSHVITDIKKKKESFIEKESRIQVAENNRLAEIKEIEAKRDAEIAAEQSQQAIGERAAEKDKAVGVAQEIAQQDIKEQARLTAEKDMAVKKVEQVKQAEIDKEVAVVKAEEEKQSNIIKAEGQKLQTITIAEGNLAEKEKEAEGLKAVGLAEAEAEKAMQMAPVEAQIKLAEKIAQLPAYMEYLLGSEGLKTGEKIGIAKAEALKSGDLKVIATAGGQNGAEDGVNSIMDLFGANGGTKIGAMLDALKNTEVGKDLLTKLISTPLKETKIEQKHNEKEDKKSKDSKIENK